MIGYDDDGHHKKIEGTRVHAAVTEGSLPVTVMISAANIHEGTKLIPLMKSISIETGHRPRKRPKTVYADTKYATPLNRFYLSRQETRPITDTRPSTEDEEEAWEAKGLRQRDVQWSQVQRGEILRLAQGVQANHNQV